MTWWNPCVKLEENSPPLEVNKWEVNLDSNIHFQIATQLLGLFFMVCGLRYPNLSAMKGIKDGSTKLNRRDDSC